MLTQSAVPRRLKRLIHNPSQKRRTQKHRKAHRTVWKETVQEMGQPSALRISPLCHVFGTTCQIIGPFCTRQCQLLVASRPSWLSALLSRLSGGYMRTKGYSLAETFWKVWSIHTNSVRIINQMIEDSTDEDEEPKTARKRWNATDDFAFLASNQCN